MQDPGPNHSGAHFNECGGALHTEPRFPRVGGGPSQVETDAGLF